MNKDLNMSKIIFKQNRHKQNRHKQNRHNKKIFI